MSDENQSAARTILFVCTGNTCRSAMAEALARRWIETRKLPWRVASAGVTALDGAPASDGAKLAGRDAGLDLSAHRATQLSPAQLLESDLVLALARSHYERMCADEPQAAERIHVLRAYASRGRDGGDVLDPFAGDLQLFRETLREIEDLVDRSLERFAEDA